MNTIIAAAIIASLVSLILRAFVAMLLVGALHGYEPAIPALGFTASFIAVVIADVVLNRPELKIEHQ